MRAYLIAAEEPALHMLTHGLPAAVLPVLDEPLAGLMLHLLHRHGVEQATVVTGDGRIGASLGDGSLYGLRLNYADGWPGASEEPVLLVQGNALTDCDLTELVRVHYDKKAPITAAVHADAPAEGFGAAVLSPEASAAVAEGTAAEEILSSLAASGLAIHAAPLRGYGRMVTTPESYRAAQMDLLGGRVGLPVRGRRQGSAIIAHGSQVASGVRMTGRCYIGRFASVGPGAVIGPGTVIGRSAQVGGHAYLENACLMDNALVDGDAVLRNVMIVPRCGNSALQHMMPIGRN